MKEVVYLDVFFLWNFLMDAVSLFLAGYVASEPIKLGRGLAGSGVGALLATLFLLFPLGKWGEFLLGLLSFVPMVLTALGFRSFRRLFHISLMAFAGSFFLSGAVEFLSYYAGKNSAVLTFGIFLAAVFFALGAFSLWGKKLNKKMESLVISLSISHNGKEESLYGLIDSGAFLKDPASGDAVILVKAEYATPLLSEGELISLRTGEGEGIVPIPLRTASGKGCLYAFRPRSVRFHGKGKKKRGEAVLVALDFSGGGFGGCPCLVPLWAV